MQTNTTDIGSQLKELLGELRKVKDLNNMANEYKAVAAKLAVALDTLITEGKSVNEDNREATRTFLEHLNKADASYQSRGKEIGATLGALNDSAGKVSELHKNIGDIARQLKFDTTDMRHVAGEVRDMAAEIDKRMTSELEQVKSGMTTINSGLSSIDGKSQTLRNDLAKTTDCINRIEERLCSLEANILGRIDKCCAALSSGSKETLEAVRKLDKSVSASAQGIVSEINSLEGNIRGVRSEVSRNMNSTRELAEAASQKAKRRNFWQKFLMSLMIILQILTILTILVIVGIIK